MRGITEHRMTKDKGSSIRETRDHPDRRAGTGAVGVVTPGTGSSVHRQEALLRVGSDGLPSVEGQIY
jgi:hypothetical protein